MKPGLRGVGLALGCLCICARGTAAQQSTMDEGIFEVEIQSVPGRITVTTLVDERGTVLVPLRPVLELAGIPAKPEGAKLAIEWPPGPWRTVLDDSARVIDVAGKVESIPAQEWVVRAGQTYLAAHALGLVLDAQINVDWAGLGVVIAPKSEFPATRKLEREARRERERLATEQLADAAPDLPFIPRTGGWVGSWGVSAGGGRGSNQASARAALGGSILGGATEAGITASTAASDPFSDAYARYHRVFPRGVLVRQVELGSVLSDGLLARRMFGATVTNEPLTAPHVFAETLIDPVVPAGWEYEVYQGDALVGVASAEDAEPLRAPLNYGNTPVRVRMIGPSGEERVEELLYVVPATRLPRGEWRYSAGLGACQDPQCDSYAFGEVRAGLSSLVTASLGMDRIDLVEGDSRLRPYGSVGFTPLRGVSVEAQGEPGTIFRGAADWSTAGGGSYSASYGWNRPIGDAPTVDGWYAQLGASAPVAALGHRSVTVRTQLRGTTGAGVDSWQASAATTVHRSYMSASLEAGLQERSLLTVQAFTPIPAHAGARLQDVAVSVGGGVSTRGPELLDLGTSFRPVPTGSVNVDIRLHRGASPSMSIGFVARRPEGYLQTRAATGAAAGVFASADGGVAWDRQTGVVPLPLQSLGRSGVRGMVFYDRNGDGTQDQGELPAAGVDVMVRGERLTTDAQGRYASWEVPAYDVLDVAVDSLSVDPSWVPAPRRVRLRPSPNLFNEVNLALVRTRELSGRVEILGGEARAAGGIRIEIVDSAGTVVASPRTFSDGVFYVQRLVPGRYTVRVSTSSLQALGAAASDPVPLDLGADSDLPVELPTLRLEVAPGR